MKIFLRETIISLLCSILLLILLAILISHTSIKEKIITPCVIIISAVSIFLGSIRISRTKKKQGIINGILLGMSYIFGMYFISSLILKDFSLNIKSLIMIFSGIIGGVIGGIIGVNL